MTWDPSLPLYTKSNSEWIIDLNVKARTIKLLGEKKHRFIQGLSGENLVIVNITRAVTGLGTFWTALEHHEQVELSKGMQGFF